jgi:hypothetical protein
MGCENIFVSLNIHYFETKVSGYFELSTNVWQEEPLR